MNINVQNHFNHAACLIASCPEGSLTSKHRALVYCSRVLVTALLMGWLVQATASPASTGRSLAETYQVREFREIDQDYVAIALRRVNDLVGQYYGARLSYVPARDIGLLQRLLDEKKVAFDDPGTLQALGVALGELMRRQRELVWVRYIDAQGSARALQLKREPYFLYPVTAIWRRAEVGAPVDVEAIYQRALSQIDAYVERQRNY
ncbi:MAG: DUF3806 domain-containing protein [Pseudomonadales bacterium]